MDKFRIKDPVLRERARRELGETDEVRTAALEQLRKLIEGDPRICGEVKDELLVAYLRTTKFNAHAAYTRVKKLAQMMMHPLVQKWLVEYSDVETILGPMRQKLVVHPEGYDSDTRKVVTILGGNRWNPERLNLGELALSLALSVLADALDERSQVGGFVIICDNEGAGIKQLIHLTPTFLYVCGSIMKDCLPVRVKQIHVSNVPLVARGIIKILFSFVGDKIRQRFLVYGNDFSAEKSGIPEHLLPVDLGGSCPHMTQTSHICDIVENAERVGVFQSIRDLKYV